MTEMALIALGGNLGDPQRQLSQAVIGLTRLGAVVGRSSLYRTAPVGGPPGQPDYLNAVVALVPAWPYAEPEQLLAALLALERAQGRERRERWAPRPLDLDLLSWGDRVITTATLTLPHPRMMERAFVLAPLCELVPTWRHPVSGISACAALASLSDQGWVKTDLPWLDGAPLGSLLS